MEYEIGDDKIEQNVQRLRNFIFHTLGCGKKDAKKIINLFEKEFLRDQE